MGLSGNSNRVRSYRNIRTQSRRGLHPFGALGACRRRVCIGVLLSLSHAAHDSTRCCLRYLGGCRGGLGCAGWVGALSPVARHSHTHRHRPHCFGCNCAQSLFQNAGTLSAMPSMAFERDAAKAWRPATLR